MNDKMVSAVRRILFEDQFVGTRLILALSEFTWAILLLWPGDSFSRPTYSVMAKVMPEEAWGFVFLASGVTQLSIVLREDFYCALARYFAAWNAALWVYVVISMLLSVSPPPAAVSGEIVLAMAATWIWIKPHIIFNGIVYARKQRQ